MKSHTKLFLSLLSTGLFLLPVQMASAQQPKGQKPDPKAQDQRGEKSAQRGVLGVRFAQSRGAGVFLTYVAPKSPAATAGLRAGDYLLADDDQQVNSPEELLDALDNTNPGDQVSLTAWRNGKKVNMKTKLGSREDLPQNGEFPAFPQREKEAWLGVGLAESEKGGATISHVYPSGPAARSGLREGDVLLAINGENIDSPQAVAGMIRGMKPEAEAKCQVLRDGEKRTISVTLDEQSNFRSMPRFDFDDYFDRFQNGDDENGIPEHAMMLEQHRRFAEQHERIEAGIDALREEIRQLREEVRALRGGKARPGKTKAADTPAKPAKRAPKR